MFNVDLPVVVFKVQQPHIANKPKVLMKLILVLLVKPMIIVLVTRIVPNAINQKYILSSMVNVFNVLITLLVQALPLPVRKKIILVLQQAMLVQLPIRLMFMELS